MFALLRGRGVEEVSDTGVNSWPEGQEMSQCHTSKLPSFTIGKCPFLLAQCHYYDALLCLQHWPLSSVGYKAMGDLKELKAAC